MEATIKENLSQFRRAIIITDGVFSMDGDVTPLDKIYEVAQRYDILLMVDDAHGEGVLGKGGHESGQVRLRVIHHTDQKMLEQHVHHFTLSKAHCCTDEWLGYNHIIRAHATINHGQYE